MKGEKVFSRKVNLFLTCSIVPEIIPQWPISAQEKKPLFLPTRQLKERKIIFSYQCFNILSVLPIIVSVLDYTVV